MDEMLQTLVKNAEPYAKRFSTDLYDAPPVQFLIDTLIPLNSVVGLTGFPGCGKTWFALEAMRAVATGGKFLDEFKAKQTPVLLVGNDSSYLDYARQWRRLTRDEWNVYQEEARQGNVPHNPLDADCHFILQSDFTFDDINNIARMIATSQRVSVVERMEVDAEDGSIDEIHRDHYGLIVFDCLSRLTNAQENSNTEMSAVFKNIRTLAEATGASILLLHHNASPSENRSGEEWRGAGASGAGIASLDVHLHLKRQSMDTVHVKARKFRGLTPPEFKFVLDVNKQESIAELTYLDKMAEVHEVEESLIEDLVYTLKMRNNIPLTIRNFTDALHSKYITFDSAQSLYNFIAARITIICGMPDPKIVRVGKVGLAHTYKLSPTETQKKGNE